MPYSDIVVVGSSNTDMIIKLNHAPRPGETVLGGEFFTAAGGKGANQAVAAARFGGRVTFVARLGRDTLGDQAIARLMNDGIDVSHVSRDPQIASGAALIFVAKNGENSIAVAPGANGRLSAADVRKARASIADAKILLLQLEIPLNAVTLAADLAFSRGVKVILNPAPARSLPPSLLRHVSILTPNESEAELLTGVTVTGSAAARRAAEKLREMGVETVILTMGSKGALIVDSDGSRLVHGFKVKAVDTTAAGDIFNGALAVSISAGKSIDESVHLANAAAAISVTRLGAQPSAPTRTEIEVFLKQGRITRAS